MAIVNPRPLQDHPGHALPKRAVPKELGSQLMIDASDSARLRLKIGQSMERGSCDCVELDSACKVLVNSSEVQSLIKKAVGPKRLQKALLLMKEGNLEGDLGAEIHDLLTDSIRNHAKVVWTGLIRQPHDDYPVRVNEFNGVFWVWAMEYDPVGYFLKQDSAVSYARLTWDALSDT